MENRITPGNFHTLEKTVTEADTARVHGSGKLPVLATPALVAWMEQASWMSLEGRLAEGEDTVGIEMQIKHLKATSVGQRVSCRATVAEVDGRRIRFTIEAHDDSGVIGTAVHDRFIIQPEKFMARLAGIRHY